MSERLKRRDLPLVKQLPNKYFDIDKVREEFTNLGYDKFSNYNDLSYAGVYKHLCEQHYDSVHSKFMTPAEMENSKVDLSKRDYIQLALTDFDNDTFPDAEKTFKVIDDKMTRIRASMDPSNPNYHPILDERNYSKRNEFVKGIFAEIFDSFKAKITRSRFAVLMPGAEGKIHTDYDTDYSIRVHYPIYTSIDCKIGFAPAGGEIEEIHMPADGHFYFINQGIPHYVYNRGTEPRIHLVMTLESQEDLHA